LLIFYPLNFVNKVICNAKFSETINALVLSLKLGEFSPHSTHFSPVFTDLFFVHISKKCRDGCYEVISSDWDQTFKRTQFSLRCLNAFFLVFFHTLGAENFWIAGLEEPQTIECKTY